MSLSVGCSLDVQGDRDARAAIDELRRDHVDAVNARDADRVLAGMTTDVVYLAPGLQPITGRDSLEAIIRAAYQEFQPQIDLVPKEVVLTESWAYEWGCLAGQIQPLAGGDAIPNAGQYSFIYRWSEATGWAIARDIYNASPCM